MPTDERVSEFLQYISEGFVLVDADFRVLNINAEAERLDSRPAKDILGKLLWDAWPQYVEGTPLRELWETVMRTREPALLEQLSLRPWRDPIWLEIRAFPSGDGISVYYRDVTERKRTEEELKRVQQELIHASRISAMGAMASTLAHELSQPLTTIGNYVETTQDLMRGMAPGDIRKARQALGFAAAATQRASEILRRLRAFVSKGKVEADLHDIQVVIADAAVLMLPQARRENVEIQFDLDRYAKWVMVDAVQIQQVLVNLVRNAIEAMQESAEKRITISTAPVGEGRIEVTVRDTGPGFESDSEALFSPFHSSKSDGMGVGLSISRTIIEAHGGVIAAERETPPAKGAVFRFTLPRGLPT